MQYFDGARLSQNSVRNAIWHALNKPVLPIFTEKHALFDRIHFHSRGIRLTTAEMRECGTQANARHWTSRTYRGKVLAVFHRSRYVYINFQVIISIT
jgi:hypothetical protein